MKHFKQRFAERDTRGLTLIELVVGMFIMGLVSLLVFSIYIATGNTASSVQSASVSIADTQNTITALSNEVRNSDSFQITDEGRRLDITKTDGLCRAWVLHDGKLWENIDSEGYEEWDDSWFVRFEEVSVPNGAPLFVAAGTTGVHYSFYVGEGAGAMEMSGEVNSRLNRDNDISPCFVTGPGGQPGDEEDEDTTPVLTEYPITYNLDGGLVTGNPAVYTVNTSFTLTNPTRSGYIFKGWTGTGLSGPTMTVTVPSGSTGSRSYTATWEAVPVYSITYNLNGGTISGQKTQYTSYDEDFTLPAPTRSGYTFSGWTGTDLSSPTQVVTVAKGSSGARTYTATWTENASSLQGRWEQSAYWHNNVQGYLSFKNTTSSPVRNVDIELRVNGATSFVSGNASCTYLGDNKFRCRINGWSNTAPNSWSSSYWVQFGGMGNSNPTVTILSVTKVS